MLLDIYLLYLIIFLKKNIDTSEWTASAKQYVLITYIFLTNQDILNKIYLAQPLYYLDFLAVSLCTWFWPGTCMLANKMVWVCLKHGLNIWISLWTSCRNTWLWVAIICWVAVPTNRISRVDQYFLKGSLIIIFSVDFLWGENGFSNLVSCENFANQSSSWD